ncbi:MAG: hypothetical protein LC637_07260, partial [Xanthomonadaceae bacterium]|nr:hypothetical protein [Xanthomonadaceae bacterium]
MSPRRGTLNGRLFPEFGCTERMRNPPHPCRSLYLLALVPGLALQAQTVELEPVEVTATRTVLA